MSALYDFSGSGLGTFTFDPVSRFQVIGVNDTVETTLGATPIVNAKAHSVSITITDDASKRELKLEKRVDIKCPDESKRRTIDISTTEARYMAAVAILYIKKHGRDQLYNDYFGVIDVAPAVVDRFKKLLEPSPKPLSCSPPAGSCGDWFAHSNKDGIFYCDKYFSQKGIQDICNVHSANSLRGGTTLRMLTTLLFRTSDRKLDCAACKRLNDSDKIFSAGNYEVSIQNLSGTPRVRC